MFTVTKKTRNAYTTIYYDWKIQTPTWREKNFQNE